MRVLVGFEYSGTVRDAFIKKQPYLRDENWVDPEYHFWENGNYTEAAKERLRAFVASIKLTLVQQANVERKGLRI